MWRPDSYLTLATASTESWGEHVVRNLAVALRGQTLYGAFHPTVVRAGEEVVGALSFLLLDEDSLTISLTPGGISLNGHTLSSAMGIAADLFDAAASHHIGQITFSGDVTAEDVAVLVSLLGKPPSELQTEGGLARALATQGVACILCEPTRSPAESAASEGAPDVDSSLLSTYGTALEVIQDSAQQARLGRVLNISAAQAHANQLADVMMEDQAKLLGLLSIRRHDEYTFQHSLNICILALALGMALGLDRQRLHELGLAAFLHDVGKAWVPLEVLRKPGPLSEDELALIRRHPTSGAVYLSQQRGMPSAAALVAFQHHLRYDQRGYPELRWPQSPNAYSLVVGIADAYEALTSGRPYRRALGPEEALSVMLTTPPGQFEPRMLSVFAEMLSRSHVLHDPKETSQRAEPPSRPARVSGLLHTTAFLPTPPNA